MEHNHPLRIRLFLLGEAAAFLAAGLVHFGALGAQFADSPASIAETSIGLMLLIGLGLSWVWQRHTRVIGLIAQTLALLGTLVGAFTIAIGVGPRRPGDIAFHIAILAVLTWGLVVASRATPSTERAGQPATAPGR